MSTALRHTLIKASAGSGKTFQLSNRFIALLALNEAPERILATTFTRKAAGEILSRVFTRLAHGASSRAAAAQLASDVEQGELSQSRCRELLQNLIRSQHKLSICTMDSFCVNVARAFGLELGFGTSWEIIDEDRDRAFREEALQSLLYELDPGEVSTLARLLGNEAAGRSVYAALLSKLGALHQLYADSPREAWGALQIPTEIDATALSAAITALATHVLPRTQKGKGDEDRNWFKARATAVARAAERDWEVFVGGGVASKILAGEPTFNRHEISDEVRALYAPLIQQARAVLLGRVLKSTSALAQLLGHFDRAYCGLKEGAGALHFADIKRALAKANALRDLSSLYYRLDSCIHHLLLDEFQDTSREEWGVVLPLAEEILSQGVDRRSFFCVGDVKQAIYGWRGGVAEIFDAVEERFSAVLDRTRLDESRRSAPEIIDCVNTVFSSLGDNPALSDFLNVREVWARRFSRHTAHHTDRHGYVELRCTAAGEETERYAGLYQDLGALVRTLVERAPDAQIGILVRRNKIAARIRYELQRPECGIMAREEGGSPVTDSPAVAYVLSLLRLSDHPGDTVARFHVATSPLGMELAFTQFADDKRCERLAQHVRSRLIQDGYAATVRWTQQLLASYCSRRDQERLSQLAELALLFEPRATLRTEEFIRFVESSRRESTGDSNVRVMTIHQSKGLEFDIVILPELDRPLVGERRGRNVLYDRSAPLAPVRSIVCAPSRAVTALDPRLQAMKQQMDDAVVGESLSVLYVALTRAKQALYMLVPPRLSEDAEGDQKQTKERKEPVTFARLLQGACAPESEFRPGEILYQRGDSQWYEKRGAHANTASVSEECAVSLRLKERAGSRSRLLPRQSPSSLEGDEMCNVATLLRVESSRARDAGTLLHRLFEQVTWLEDALPDDATLTGIMKRYTQVHSENSGILHDFHSAIGRPQIAAVLSRARYAAWPKLEVWRERGFALRSADKLLSGAFDRVVIGRDSSGALLGAEIVDFKSDRHGDETRTEYYRPQIEAYRQALSQLIGLAPASIKAALVFVRSGQVVYL